MARELESDGSIRLLTLCGDVDRQCQEAVKCDRMGYVKAGS